MQLLSAYGPKSAFGSLISMTQVTQQRAVGLDHQGLE